MMVTGMFMGIAASRTARSGVRQESTHLDAPARNQVLEPRGIVFRPALQRDQKNLPVEPHSPVQVAGLVAELDCIGGPRQRPPQPAPRLPPGPDCSLSPPG